LCAFILSIVTITASGQQIDAPQSQRGSIRGTVTDVDDAAIPRATVTVDGPLGANTARSTGIGGNLIAGSLTNLYHPPGNRGPGLAFSSMLINAGGPTRQCLGT
jgi:hypothetical protein